MEHDEAFTFIQRITADLAHGVTVFPTSFDTTLKLREMLQTEASSIGDITKLLRLDPLLAARIVQAANTVALNPGGAQVTDLRAAVVRLGLLNVRTMSLAIAMRQFLGYREMSRYAHLTEPLIRHSREVAASAMIIAREHTRLSPDLGMFTGLVHDIGVFYMLYRLGSHGALALDPAQVERMLDDWRGDVGRAVLAALDVPKEIQDAISLHHWPRQVETIRSLDDLLYVCKLLVRYRAAAARHELADAERADAATVTDFDLYLATLDGRQDELNGISALF